MTATSRDNSKDQVWAWAWAWMAWHGMTLAPCQFWPWCSRRFVYRAMLFRAVMISAICPTYMPKISIISALSLLAIESQFIPIAWKVPRRNSKLGRVAHAIPSTMVKGSSSSSVGRFRSEPARAMRVIGRWHLVRANHPANFGPDWSRLVSSHLISYHLGSCLLLEIVGGSSSPDGAYQFSTVTWTHDTNSTKSVFPSSLRS